MLLAIVRDCCAWCYKLLRSPVLSVERYEWEEEDRGTWTTPPDQYQPVYYTQALTRTHAHTHAHRHRH
eukprot:135380-Pyramimonas_sp.AAC.1